MYATPGVVLMPSVASRCFGAGKQQSVKASRRRACAYLYYSDYIFFHPAKIEQRSCNQTGRGSIPGGGTLSKKDFKLFINMKMKSSSN